LKIIHRQIFKEHVYLFLLIGSCLLGLILVGRMLQLRELLLSQNLGVLDILRLFVYLSPFFMLLLTPIACMLSVFLTFLRMAADRELTALKASGVSLYQLLPAPLLFCGACTLFSLYVSLYGVSWGMEQFKVSLWSSRALKPNFHYRPAYSIRNSWSHHLCAAGGFGFRRHPLRLCQDKTSKGLTTTVVAPVGSVTTDSPRNRSR
jgi:lipopolysaccharide export system permease protein